jgi:hypothetical protein
MIPIQTDTDRWVYRLGGAAGIVGALLGLVGNLAHPVTPVGDPEGVARIIAASDAWIPIHLVILLGILLMLGGLGAIGHSIRDGLAGALARFGLLAAVVGTTIGLVLVTLDGFAARQLAELWAAAPPADRAIAAQLVQMQETANFALIAAFNLFYAGATFGLFGLAAALSGVYPRWPAWLVVVAAAGGVAAGVIQSVAGVSEPVTMTLGILAPTIFTLWLAAMGVVLVRSARVRTASYAGRSPSAATAAR